MYIELYDVWQREIESGDLAELPPNFYPKSVDYLRLLRQEGRMLDKKTVKAKLLSTERIKVERMIREIFMLRYRKLMRRMISGREIGQHLLTPSEEKLRSHCLPAIDEYRASGRSLVRGRLETSDMEKRQHTVLRFLKEVPQIIGVDLKAYGPFKTEDIASLPTENGEVLMKQKLAEKVEVH